MPWGVGHENLPGGSKIRDDGEAERSRGKFASTWWDEDKKSLFEEKQSVNQDGVRGRREKDGKKKGRPPGRPGNKSIYYIRFANLAQLAC
jgi:hypothetical protein